ncbi:MAG: hypothetical protein CSA33_01885 [Desulfobulbus propionicus]|nr:MAG: hypothetical protein CSA33_01885 [Desulfobulbus propionicus]
MDEQYKTEPTAAVKAAASNESESAQIDQAVSENVAAASGIQEGVPDGQSSSEQTADQLGAAPQMQLPPGYVIHPATGQMVYLGQPQPVQYVPMQSAMMYVPPQQPTPEQLAALQEAAQQRQSAVLQSMQNFIDGEATVSDVVKTLYTTTVQDDQLWKGILVGAAAAVLLTSDSVRETMGKTLGSVLPGAHEKQTPTRGDSVSSADTVTEDSSDKE